MTGCDSAIQKRCSDDAAACGGCVVCRLRDGSGCADSPCRYEADHDSGPVAHERTCRNAHSVAHERTCRHTYTLADERTCCNAHFVTHERTCRNAHSVAHQRARRHTYTLADARACRYSYTIVVEAENTSFVSGGIQPVRP